MNVNHYCEALNSIQAAWDAKEISHENYLQAIAEIGYWYYLQDDAICMHGDSPRIVFSEYDPKPDPVELPKPIGYVSKHAPEDLANGSLCTITPDKMLDDGQDWEIPVFLAAQPSARPSLWGCKSRAGNWIEDYTDDPDLAQTWRDCDFEVVAFAETRDAISTQPAAQEVK